VPGRRQSSSTPVDEKTIGRRLRELRHLRGMKQVAIAQAVGVEQSLVSNYERGKVRMHGALVAAFAKALGVSADEVLGLEEPRQRQLAVVNDRRFIRRLQLIDRLSRRQKDALLTTLDTFLRGAGLDPRAAVPSPPATAASPKRRVRRAGRAARR